MLPFNWMQNSFGGMNFTLKFSPGFQGKGTAVEERGVGGRGGDERDRREGDPNTHFLYLFIKIKIRAGSFTGHGKDAAPGLSRFGYQVGPNHQLQESPVVIMDKELFTCFGPSRQIKKKKIGKQFDSWLVISLSMTFVSKQYKKHFCWLIVWLTDRLSYHSPGLLQRYP